MNIDTPIYDQMVDEGFYPDVDRYMTDTEAERHVTASLARWAPLLERLTD